MRYRKRKGRDRKLLGARLDRSEKRNRYLISFESLGLVGGMNVDSINRGEKCGFGVLVSYSLEYLGGLGLPEVM